MRAASATLRRIVGFSSPAIFSGKAMFFSTVICG